MRHQQRARDHAQVRDDQIAGMGQMKWIRALQRPDVDQRGRAESEVDEQISLEDVLLRSEREVRHGDAEVQEILDAEEEEDPDRELLPFASQQNQWRHQREKKESGILNV